MSLTLETVVNQLSASGVVAPGKLERFLPPHASPGDAQALLDSLVKQKHLTPYQAGRVQAGEAHRLILGGYTLLDTLGAGGMGQVFKAEHRRMKRLVAIKMLPAGLMKDPAAVARFEREVEAAARLEHPNIVAAYDADEADGVHFLVMQFVEGSDLSVLVKQQGPLPVAKAVNYILQAARGLQFAHHKGIVHRDIKPGNLLLGKDGVVRILDMGLARIHADNDSNTQAELTDSGAVMGTVEYMAPDQALDVRRADARADIYSLGCTLYYLIAGKPMYAGQSLMAKLLAHREQPAPSLADEQSGVPQPLDAVFQKMVAKQVADRYQSMTEVIEALEGLELVGAETGEHAKHAPAATLAGGNRNRLTAKTVKPPLRNLGQAVASERSKHLVAKLVGGAFATIIAPILVAYLIKYLERGDSPSPQSANHPSLVGDSQQPREKELGWQGPPREASAPAIAPFDAGQATRHKDFSPLRGDEQWNTPTFQKWVEDVQAMPPERQLEAVARKLTELNPGFDGKLTGCCGIWANRPQTSASPKIRNGAVTELGFDTDRVSDISPVRALRRLTRLSCTGRDYGKGLLVDLSPLRGLPLKELNCRLNRLSDLSKLTDVPLDALNCSGTGVRDLSPLGRLPLTSLVCVAMPLTSLSGLKGLRLKNLACYYTKVSDLAPLEGMPLAKLICFQTSVSSLAPLRGMPLASLDCQNTPISDLSPLAGMPLAEAQFDATQVSDLSPLETCKDLRRLTLDDTKVTVTALERLKKALPGCEVICKNPLPGAAAGDSDDR